MVYYNVLRSCGLRTNHQNAKNDAKHFVAMCGPIILLIWDSDRSRTEFL